MSKVITRGNLSLITPEGLDDSIAMPKNLRVTRSAGTSIRAIANGFGMKIPAAVQAILNRSATTIAQQLGVVVRRDEGICGEGFLTIGVSSDTQRWLENEARNTPGSTPEIEAARALTSYIRMIESERELVERYGERGKEQA